MSPVLPILPITGCQQKREHRTTGMAALLYIVFGDNVAMSAPANPHHWKDTKEKAYQIKSRLEPRTTDRCSGPNLLSDMRLFFSCRFVLRYAGVVIDAILRLSLWRLTASNERLWRYHVGIKLANPHQYLFVKNCETFSPTVDQSLSFHLIEHTADMHGS